MQSYEQHQLEFVDEQEFFDEQDFVTAGQIAEIIHRVAPHIEYPVDLVEIVHNFHNKDNFEELCSFVLAMLGIYRTDDLAEQLELSPQLDSTLVQEQFQELSFEEAQARPEIPLNPTDISLNDFDEEFATFQFPYAMQEKFDEQESKAEESDSNPPQMLHKPQPTGDEPVEACEICSYEVSLSHIFRLTCKHSYCVECLQTHISNAMNDGRIPQCACCSCDVSVQDVGKLFPHEDPHSRKLSGLIRHQRSACNRKCVACPNASCDYWVDTSASTNRYTCKQCFREFCSSCKSRYHYRGSCEDVPLIVAKWAEKTKISDAIVRTRRLEELRQDETWKAQNLRCCPHCNRAVLKNEGCNLMKCGEDFHGGNRQQGCGKSFSWRAAPRYQPSDEFMNEKLHETGATVRFKQSYLQGAYCGNCNVRISKVHFECIYCPNFLLCEECGVSDRLNHPSDHVFELVGAEVHVDLPRKRGNQMADWKKENLNRKRVVYNLDLFNFRI